MEADRDRLLEEFEACLRRLESARPLWKKLFGLEASSNELTNLRAQYGAAAANVDSAEKEVEDLRRKIDSAKSIETELREALIRQASRRERESQERARIDGALTRSEEAVESDEFDRTRFSIINADYKRGNKIDNYLRNRMFDVIAGEFSHRCLRCESAHDLTLDHYAIPKNEGGNFVLVESGAEFILRPNVVVLCKSCNSAKGEMIYRHFFSTRQIEVARLAHTNLVTEFIADRALVHELHRRYSRGTLWGPG